ncbi:hypothetical protein BH10CYA1_BH10CYA1_32450 [soil metagenome]
MIKETIVTGIFTGEEIRQAVEIATEQAGIRSAHTSARQRILHQSGECNDRCRQIPAVTEEIQALADAAEITDAELEMEATEARRQLVRRHPDAEGQMLHRHGECDCLNFD